LLGDILFSLHSLKNVALAGFLFRRLCAGHSKTRPKKLHYGFSTVASEEVFPLNPARKLWIVFEKEER